MGLDAVEHGYLSFLQIASAQEQKAIAGNLHIGFDVNLQGERSAKELRARPSTLYICLLNRHDLIQNTTKV